MQQLREEKALYDWSYPPGGTRDKRGPASMRQHPKQRRQIKTPRKPSSRAIQYNTTPSTPSTYSTTTKYPQDNRYACKCHFACPYAAETEQELYSPIGAVDATLSRWMYLFLAYAPFSAARVFDGLETRNLTVLIGGIKFHTLRTGWSR
jgi:hypothetical protein